MTLPAVLHQLLTGATFGDAITGQAIIIRGWLRDLGIDSQIYAQHIHPSMADEVRSLTDFRGGKDGRLVIYHHSIGSDVAEFIAQKHLQLILIYHNITPPEYFARSDPLRGELAKLGRDQLTLIRPRTVMAIAVSPFNALDLEDEGFDNIAILPVTLCPQDYDYPVNERLGAQIRSAGPNLLFVGRLAPNKRQEDLVKLLYYCRRYAQDAHLFLVGDRWEVGYDKWVEAIATDLDVVGGLTLTGKVSPQDLATYYQTADFYVSMSEHEGFGLPLIESMYFGLPVLAYGSSGVPYTMEDAGILFWDKRYEALAEMIQLLTADQALRVRLVARQRDHVQKFLEPHVRKQFEDYLLKLGGEM